MALAPSPSPPDSNLRPRLFCSSLIQEWRRWISRPHERRCTCARAEAAMQPSTEGPTWWVLNVLYIWKAFWGENREVRVRCVRSFVRFRRYFTADLCPLPYKERPPCLPAIGPAQQPAGTLHFNPFAAEFYLVLPSETMWPGLQWHFYAFVFE